MPVQELGIDTRILTSVTAVVVYFSGWTQTFSARLLLCFSFAMLDKAQTYYVEKKHDNIDLQSSCQELKRH